MRISDWSSDVCSSDLWHEGARRLAEHLHVAARQLGKRIVRSERPLERRTDVLLVLAARRHRRFEIVGHQSLHLVAVQADQAAQEIDSQHSLAARFGLRSEERRGGKEWVSTRKYGWLTAL